jgi:1-acyl-sn-glycerol-3-phosphate acyltransferase
MRLAIETRTPIVPVGVVGAEEAMPSLHNSKFLARLFGAPSFPITPTFPWLLALGLIPYPIPMRIYFGEPLHFGGDPNDEDDVIDAKVEQVQQQVQNLVDRGLKERGPFPFWMLGGVR